MRLVDLGETLANPVGALVEAKRHRHCHRALQATLAATFTQIFEQYVASQRVAHRIQRRQRMRGAQMGHGCRQVFAGAGVITARQQIRLAGAAAPVQGDTGPALRGKGPLLAGDIV